MKRFLLLLFLPLIAHGTIIPSTNYYNFALPNLFGVSNGIPTVTTVFTNFTSIPSSGDINAAISAFDGTEASPKVIQLPAGTITLTNRLTLLGKNGLVLRGMGMGVTVLEAYITGSAGSGATIQNTGVSQGTPTTIVSGATNTSTSIVVTSAANMVVGRNMEVSEDSYPDLIFSVHANASNLLVQIVRVTSVSGTTIGFFPPLCWDFVGSNVLATPDIAQRNALVGIEDLTLTRRVGTTTNSLTGGSISTSAGGNGDNTVTCYNPSHTYNAWCKNVEFTKYVNGGVFIQECLQPEFRGCLFHNPDGFADGYGIEYIERVTGALVIDNIFYSNTVSKIECKSVLNATLYNFSTNAWGNPATVPHQTDELLAEHGPHTMFNLYEGNVGMNWVSDGYHGSCSHQILLRNFFHGVNDRVGYTNFVRAVDLNRLTYWCSFVGNVLGADRWATNGSATYQLTIGHPAYNLWTVFRMGYPDLGSTSYDDADDYALPLPGPPNPGRDTNVLTRTLIHGNYDYVQHAQTWDPAIADHVIPTSYVFGSTPQFFTDAGLVFPPIDPANPGAASPLSIPAGVRYVNNYSPPPEGPITLPRSTTQRYLTR